MLRGMLCYISISNGLNLFKVEDVLVQNVFFMCNIWARETLFAGAQKGHFAPNSQLTALSVCWGLTLF